MTRKKRRRRWLSFSLRSSLVLWLIVGVALGWIGREVYQARRQEHAVSRIRELGGYVLYEYQIAELKGESALRRQPRFQGTAPSPIPDWVSRYLGDDFLLHVAVVDLSGGSGANSGGARRQFVFVAGTPGVTFRGRALRAPSPRPARGSIGDADVIHLQPFKKIRELDLTFQNITDKGIMPISRFRQLERLILQDTQVTDGGLRHLSALTKLKRLNLYNTRVTAEGVEDLRRRLPNCGIWWDGDL